MHEKKLCGLILLLFRLFYFFLAFPSPPAFLAGRHVGLIGGGGGGKRATAAKYPASEEL